MQLTLFSFWNPAMRDQSLTVNTERQSQVSLLCENESKGRESKIVIERSSSDPHITLQMDQKLYNTAQYFLKGQKDPIKRRLLEQDEQDEKCPWLIDTEIIEISKLLWKRKCDIKKLLQFNVGELI